MEWCADWYEETYYAKSPVDNPPGPALGLYRIVRGGSWFADAYLCRSANRDIAAVMGRANYQGFRVALVAVE
jgi:formylglycine-generating enzyme